MPTYRFGEFELDLDAQELRAGGQSLRLERRPMDLLVLLVRAHGKLVTRDELIAALWPQNVIIDFDSGLNTLVRKVRQALGDSSDQPRFIVTVPGRGYRFVAPVGESVGAPALPLAVPPPAAPPPASPPEAPPAPAQTRMRPGRIAAASLLLLLLVAGALALTRWNAADTGLPGTRIAVLPFENLTGDDELGYLASGLAEETGISLSRIELPDFSVIGGMSARTVAAGNRPLREIGEQLDADYLVVSSLRREGSRIRVTSRLIEVADDEQVWSDSFDRELTNPLGLQRELSIAIAEQVRQRLSPDVAAAIDRRQTRNPEAYKLYLQGLHIWHQFELDSVARALEFYEAAVSLDPRYALAWAEISRAYASSLVTRNARLSDVAEPALDALQRALEYGPELHEVHLAAASYQMFIEQDPAAAEAAGRRAIALGPDNGVAHMVLGLVLGQRSKFAEANRMLRRAREVEPFFPLIFANSANVAIVSGDPGAGLDYARQAIAINPEFWPGYLHMGNALVRLGDVDGALAAFAACERYSGGNPMGIASRAALLALHGREAEARVILDELESFAESEYVASYWFGSIHAALGEHELALEWLERSLQAQELALARADSDWRLSPLHDDPRFQDLMERCQCSRRHFAALAASDASRSADANGAVADPPVQ